MLFVIHMHWWTKNNVYSPERKRERVLLKGRGQRFSGIWGHEALQGPWTKSEVYMLQTTQTFLGILQTIPVSDESTSKLKNYFTSSEEKLSSFTVELKLKRVSHIQAKPFQPSMQSQHSWISFDANLFRHDLDLCNLFIIFFCCRFVLAPLLLYKANQMQIM